MKPKDDEVLPDYIQKYLDAVDYEGYPGFPASMLRNLKIMMN